MVPVLNASNKMAPLDKNLVEMYASQYEIYRNAYEDIKENGQVTKVYKTVVNPVTGDVIANDMTGYKRNPSTQIYSDAIKQLKSLGSELGLSPASRAELMQLSLDDGKDKPSATEQLQALLNGGGDDES
ncbi:Phage terminase, small subunit [Weissella confusa]|nr:Phage terminase, small subunit [Weissella confusa]COJ69111.1 prophage pi3 protein 27%2C terminase small subunit [Streptococcus pneumoniae]